LPTSGSCLTSFHLSLRRFFISRKRTVASLILRILFRPLPPSLVVFFFFLPIRVVCATHHPLRHGSATLFTPSSFPDFHRDSRPRRRNVSLLQRRAALQCAWELHFSLRLKFSFPQRLCSHVFPMSKAMIRGFFPSPVAGAPLNRFILTSPPLGTFPTLLCPPVDLLFGAFARLFSNASLPSDSL